MLAKSHQTWSWSIQYWRFSQLLIVNYRLLIFCNKRHVIRKDLIENMLQGLCVIVTHAIFEYVIRSKLKDAFYIICHDLRVTQTFTVRKLFLEQLLFKCWKHARPNLHPEIFYNECDNDKTSWFLVMLAEY